MFNKREILDRLKEALGFGTDAELVRFLGISKSTMSNWVSRNTLDYELVFSKCEHVNEAWIIRGIPPMLKVAQEKPTYQHMEPLPNVAEDEQEYSLPVDDPFYMTKFYYNLYMQSSSNFDNLTSRYEDLVKRFNELAALTNLNFKGKEVG